MDVSQNDNAAFGKTFYLNLIISFAIKPRPFPKCERHVVKVSKGYMMHQLGSPKLNYSEGLQKKLKYQFDISLRRNKMLYILLRQR